MAQGSIRTSPSGPLSGTEFVTGFPNRTDSVLSVNAATRTLTLAPVGASFSAHVDGREFIYSTPQTVVWPNTEGNKFAYLDSDGVLKVGSAAILPSLFTGTRAIVSSVYWDATNTAIGFFADERHGFMYGPTHLYLHVVNGAMWVPGGGGALTDIQADAGGGLNRHAQLGVENVIIYDEDLAFSYTDGNPQNLVLPAQIPVYYLLGANSWRKVAADDFPFIYSGKGGYVGPNGRIPYNQLVGANWQLTETLNNDFVLVHFYATNEINEPVIAITGQATYLNQNTARLGATTELTNLRNLSRLLSQEEAPLGTVILQSNAGYGNSVKAQIRTTDLGDDYVDFRGTRQTDLRP